jgi:hypothetical protein
MSISDIGKKVKVLASEFEGEIVAFIEGLFHVELTDKDGCKHRSYYAGHEIATTDGSVLGEQPQSVDEKIGTEAEAPNATNTASADAGATNTTLEQASATDAAAGTNEGTQSVEGNAESTGVSASESGAIAAPTVGANDNPKPDASATTSTDAAGGDAADEVAAQNAEAANSSTASDSLAESADGYKLSNPDSTV